ncbi:MAG: DUF116 domain-containing protein [bacterium]|nr:DUF116 domain-containing protein [bacterium]
MNPRRPAYRSPWRHRAFVLAVTAVRSLLARAGRSDEALIRRLVTDNNRRVARHLAAHGAATVLLILPRCVKRSCCKIDNGGSLSTCLGCDRCDLGELARIADHHRVEALVAFRSQVAFALARERRPDLIIATACERPPGQGPAQRARDPGPVGAADGHGAHVRQRHLRSRVVRGAAAPGHRGEGGGS